MNVVAQPLTYEEFMGVIQARIEALDVAYSALEPACGLTGGHLGKLMGVARTKMIGLQSLLKLLEGVGYRIHLVEHLTLDATKDELDRDYKARTYRREKGRLRKQLSPAIITAAARQYGAMGKGKPKTFRISPSQLTRKQRKAARARWYGQAKPTKQHVGVSNA